MPDTTEDKLVVRYSEDVALLQNPKNWTAHGDEHFVAKCNFLENGSITPIKGVCIRSTKHKVVTFGKTPEEAEARLTKIVGDYMLKVIAGEREPL